VIDGNNNHSIAKLKPLGYMKFNKHINALRAALIEPRTTQPKVLVFYGPTGTGKSHMARELVGKKEEPFYIWTPARKQWFDGYCGEKNVIFEEFRGQLNYGMLLTLLDKYSCPVEFKGGTTEFSGTYIIINSPKHPSEWYPNKKDGQIQQLLRRIYAIMEFDKIFDA
jgi:hypothetical protein